MVGLVGAPVPGEVRLAVGEFCAGGAREEALALVQSLVECVLEHAAVAGWVDAD